jgi:hypothetical protein
LNGGPEISLPAEEQEAVTHLIGLLERDGVLLAGNLAEGEEI